MSEYKESGSFDLEDGNPDGLESLNSEEIVEESHPYGIVTAEDLGTDELIDDGADPATWGPDDPEVATDVELRRHEDSPSRSGETIDEYLAQEEPEVEDDDSESDVDDELGSRYGSERVADVDDSGY